MESSGYLASLLVRGTESWNLWRQTNYTLPNLERADLREKNLSGYNLSQANLNQANLEGANLEGANLKGAELYKANLKETNLKKTILDKNEYKAYKINYFTIFLATYLLLILLVLPYALLRLDIIDKDYMVLIYFSFIGGTLFDISRAKSFAIKDIQKSTITVLKIFLSGTAGATILFSLTTYDTYDFTNLSSVGLLGGFLGRFLLEILSFIKLSEVKKSQESESLLLSKNLLSVGILVGISIAILSWKIVWYILLIIVFASLLIMVVIGYFQLNYFRSTEENSMLESALFYLKTRYKEIEDLQSKKYDR